MSVIVNNGNHVDTGERVYSAGDTIDGLTEKDEAELVRRGVCRYSQSIPEPEPVEETADNIPPDSGEGPEDPDDQPPDEDTGPDTGMPSVKPKKSTGKAK